MEGSRVWSECVYGVMHGMSMHFLHVCVCVCVRMCVLTEFWSFCTLKAADVIMSETERESPDLQTHQTGHTSHTLISQYADRTMWVLCVSVCVRLCVCFACQWLALLLCIFGCCGDNVATGDISFELTHTLSLSLSLCFFLYHSFPKFPGKNKNKMEELRYMYLYTWSNINKMKETDWKSAQTSWFLCFHKLTASVFLPNTCEYILMFMTVQRNQNFKAYILTGKKKTSLILPATNPNCYVSCHYAATKAQKIWSRI